MLLGLDTTTERLHLALVDDDRAWTRWLGSAPGRSHSAALLPTVTDLLAEAGAGPEALTGVVACVGPGGFTALRVGVATAEGLALTGLPTWGFSAFQLRARTLRLAGCRGPVWIVLDGQRQEAFLQPWGESGPLGPARKQALDGLAGVIGPDAWWAPEAFQERAAAVLPQPPFPLPDEPRATLDGLVVLCRERAQEPPETPLAPFYLRETDAEVHFPEASRHLSEALRRGTAR